VLNIDLDMFKQYAIIIKCQCNDCKKTFITQSSIEEHIETTGHRDIVKTSSGIMEDKKQNEILRYRAKLA
jgi:hypothetical protein